MADLTQPDIKVPASGMPDYTGSSRGIEPNRAFEKLFSGIGNVIETTTKMKDNDIQADIRKEARGNYDQLLSENGVGSDTTTPQGLADGISQMKTMQGAYDQGKINDTHFYGRMTAQLKALRSKYPGYEDIVDEAVQSITGVRPANSYRNALMSMIEGEQASADAELKNWDTYVKQNEEYIYVEFPDYFQNPEKYSQTEVRQYVAKRKAEDQGFQSENLRMSNLSQRDALTEEQASEVVTNRFSYEVSAATAGLNRAIGLDKLTAGQINGATPSAEEMGQIIGNFQKFKLDTKAKLLRMASSPLSEDSNETYYSVAGGPEKVNKIIEETMAQFDVIEQYLGAKDYNMANYHSKLIEYRSNRDLNTLLKDNDVLRTGSAISKISPQLGEQFFNENQAAKGSIEGLVPEMLSGVVLGKDTVGEASTRIVNARGSSEAEKTDGVRQMIDGTLKGITSSTGSPKEQADLIRGAYDPASADALFKLIKPQEYQKLFAKMYNPEVTKAIAATGDKKLMDLYTASAMDRVGAVPEIRSMAADFQTGVEYAKGMKVVYDEKSNRLVVTMEPLPGAKSGIGSIAAWQQNSMMKKMVAGKDALNTAFATLGPIIEAGGGNETEAIKAVIKNLAIDLDADKKDSIIWQLYEKVEKATTVEDQKKQLSEIGDKVTKTAGDLGGAFVEAVDELSKPIDDSGGVLDGYSFPDKAVNDAVKGGVKSLGKAVNDIGSEPMNFVAAQPKGLAKLVTSNKRGYTPDVDNLNDKMKTGIASLQQSFGENLQIVSGFRGQARNARAGGAKKSQHIHGNAVDIDVSSWPKDKRIAFIKMAREQGFGGIGVYPNSIHIDKGKTRAWGPNYSNTSIPGWAAFLRPPRKRKK